MAVSSKRISFDCRNRRRTGGALNEGIKIHGSASSLLRSSFFHRYLFFFFFFFATIGKIIGNNRSPGRENNSFQRILLNICHVV